MPATRPVKLRVLLVLVSVVKTATLLVLYCTLYPIAPETAVQFKVTPLDVIFVAAIPAGTAHAVEAVVVNVPTLENALDNVFEQIVCT